MAPSLADDVLLMIFDQIAGPTPIPWLDCVYQHERAFAPFMLASVCKRWRNIMRSSSGFWAYLGFPNDARKCDQHLGRLHIQLGLSNSTPVDVLLMVDLDKFGHEDLTSLFPGLVELVSTIRRLAPRWRSAAVRIPIQLKTAFNSDIEEECPYLTSLALNVRTGVRCLPLASALSRLYLQCDGVRVFNDTATRLPSLTSLGIYGRELDGVIDLCRAFSGQLIDLSIVDDLPADMSPQRLVFPKLCSLALDDPGYLAHLQAPLLRVIATKAANLRQDLCSMLPSCASVAHLILYGRIKPADCLKLQLPNVSCLSFHAPKEIGWTIPYLSYEIDSNVFLEVYSARMWPQLQRIVIGRTGSLPQSLMPNALLAFIANRNATHSSNPSVAKLLEVVVDCEGMPDSLNDDIAHLLYSKAG
ncbi:hypothetical protein BKA62DRAFT_689405 [Auriculariales sp. MPI-PUGE-AT-0066]|nr:hypothetical protein BKA62DRAFT_689405 [Auriculariales sp. MPI-PUGE-AT-0066]